MVAQVETLGRLEDAAALLELAHAGASDRTTAREAVVSAWLQELASAGLRGPASLRARVARRIVDVVGPQLAPEAVDDEPGPESVRSDERPAGTADARELARAALASLPLSQRTVVGLRDVHGWSLEEVAFALGVTPDLARRQLHLGRTVICAALAGVLGPRADAA